MKNLKNAIRKDLWMVLLDIVAVNAAYYLTIFIRFFINGRLRNIADERYLPAFFRFAPFYTVLAILIFILFQLYGGNWKYAGIHDMNRIIIANLCTSAVMVAGSWLFVDRMPISYYVIGGFLQLLFTAAIRFAYRILKTEKNRITRKTTINVMIVGVGDNGRLVRKQLDEDATFAAKPVCYFTHRESEAGYAIDGLPVVSDIRGFREYIRRYQVGRVVMTDSIMPMDMRKKIKDICRENQVEVQDFSGILHANSNGDVSLQRLMELTSGEVEILADGQARTFESGEKALAALAGKHEVRSISAHDNRLAVELFSYKVQPLNLFYITNRPEVALIAEKYGVDRIWIDLETLGKEKRQPGLDTVKLCHTVKDAKIIKPLLKKAELLVRVNSWYDGSEEEINEVIDAGADIIMLPYFKTVKEVDNFLNVVNKRCKTTLLLETREAVDLVDEILKRDFDEIHIGLNDLCISYGLTFMFELLANGTVEMLCEKFKKAGIPYGFGGIAKLGYGLLPAEKIIMEHYRLGSTRAILSRSFCDSTKIEDVNEIDRVFRENLAQLREYELSMAGVTQEEFLRNKAEVVKAVDEIVAKIRRARGNEM